MKDSVSQEITACHHEGEVTSNSSGGKAARPPTGMIARQDFIAFCGMLAFSPTLFRPAIAA